MGPDGKLIGTAENHRRSSSPESAAARMHTRAWEAHLGKLEHHHAVHIIYHDLL